MIKTTLVPIFMHELQLERVVFIMGLHNKPLIFKFVFLKILFFLHLINIVKYSNGQQRHILL
jgi:hypothetical protein